MKCTKIVCTYAASRSQNYQSARIERSVEMEVCEGEDRNAAIAKVNAWLVEQVNRDVEAAIQDLLDPPSGLTDR